MQMKATDNLPATFAVDIPEAEGLEGVKMAQLRYVRYGIGASPMQPQN